MTDTSATVYLASPVFREMGGNNAVSAGLRETIQHSYKRLSDATTLIESTERFPDALVIEAAVKHHKADFIGCHLSHVISSETLSMPWVKGVSTSTAGYNHIAAQDDVVITNTPSVLDKATADYTIAAILSNLRSITQLHSTVWNGQWSSGNKWDLDNNLGNSIDNLVLGIVGLGEIGREVVRRIAPWGVKIIYFSRTRKTGFENQYHGLEYVDSIDALFERADIVSLHLLLNDTTYRLVDEALLRKMKPGSLLVNTARGEIIDYGALIRLLKSNEISINLALDVFDPEPLSKTQLSDFHEINQKRPELRFTLLPHNASADADTRARMVVMMLDDLFTLVTSTGYIDIQKANLIPGQRDIDLSRIEAYRIADYWKKL